MWFIERLGIALLIGIAFAGWVFFALFVAEYYGNRWGADKPEDES